MAAAWVVLIIHYRNTIKYGETPKLRLEHLLDHLTSDSVCTKVCFQISLYFIDCGTLCMDCSDVCDLVILYPATLGDTLGDIVILAVTREDFARVEVIVRELRTGVRFTAGFTSLFCGDIADTTTDEVRFRKL